MFYVCSPWLFPGGKDLVVAGEGSIYCTDRAPLWVVRTLHYCTFS